MMAPRRMGVQMAGHGGPRRGAALAGLVVLLAGLLGCGAPAAPAAKPTASPAGASAAGSAAAPAASELATLEQAARREGRLVIYATGADNMDKLLAGFRRKYP